MRQARIIIKNAEALYYISNELKPELPDIPPGHQKLLEKIIFEASDFFRTEVVAYMVYKRGYANLIRVPKRKKVSLAEMIENVTWFYGETAGNTLRDLSKYPASDKFLKLRGNYEKKFYNLRDFAGEFATKFSLEYNRYQKRKGEVWRQRFRSHPVVDKNEYLLRATAFAHTRPVFEGAAKYPSECRFSSWSKALRESRYWRKVYVDIAQADNWRAAKRIYDKNHVEMGVRTRRPFWGQIDQKIIDDCRSEGRLTPEKLKQREREWQKKFRELKKYAEEHGTFLFPRKLGKYRDLVEWVRNQIRYHEENRMGRAHIDALKSINFPFDQKSNIEPPSAWMKNFKRLKEHAEKNGSVYPCNDPEIIRWMNSQRKKKKRLSISMIELLDSLRFPWEIDWDE